MKILNDIKKNWIIFFLIALSILPLFDLFHLGLPLTHDGQDHVARIANFYKNLQEGVIVPRWAANLNWGYGHPILMFLYPIPSYAASLFHFFGFSLVDSVKIVFGLAFILSGLTMYLWTKSFLNQRAGFIAALLYMFAPYRFIDLYVRGAIGEHAAFIFPPLIFYFLLKSAKRRSYWYIVGGGLSLAGLILSHNAISLMFLPLIGLYILYLYSQAKERKEFIISAIGIVLLGFSLAAFFWMPALLEGRYTLRDKVIAGEYATRFIPFSNFFRDPPGYDGNIPFSMQVGIIQWVIIFLSLPYTYILYKRKNRFWMMSGAMFLVFSISLFLITESSRGIWEKISILQNFQFPWRFLSVVVFVSAILGGIVAFQLSKRFTTIFVIIITIIVLLLNNKLWKVNNFIQKPETFFTGVYESTTDTGESAPMWSVRFMERRPKTKIEIIEGKGEIKKIERTSTRHIYTLQADDTVRVVENTLFFPGWEVQVNGQTVPLQFQEPKYRGLMTFFVPKGANTIVVFFRETKLRMIANGITVGAICIFLGIGIYLRKRTNRLNMKKK